MSSAISTGRTAPQEQNFINTFERLVNQPYTGGSTPRGLDSSMALIPLFEEGLCAVELALRSGRRDLAEFFKSASDKSVQQGVEARIEKWDEGRQTRIKVTGPLQGFRLSGISTSSAEESPSKLQIGVEATRKTGVTSSPSKEERSRTLPALEGCSDADSTRSSWGESQPSPGPRGTHSLENLRGSTSTTRISSPSPFDPSPRNERKSVYFLGEYEDAYLTKNGECRKALGKYNRAANEKNQKELTFFLLQMLYLPTCYEETNLERIKALIDGLEKNIPKFFEDTYKHFKEYLEKIYSAEEEQSSSIELDFLLFYLEKEFAVSGDREIKETNILSVLNKIFSTQIVYTESELRKVEKTVLPILKVYPQLKWAEKKLNHMLKPYKPVCSCILL